MRTAILEYNIDRKDKIYWTNNKQ